MREETRTAITSVQDLADAGLIDRQVVAPLDEVEAHYATRLTPDVLRQIKAKSDPVYLQYVPQLRELQRLPDEMEDPTGDSPHQKVKGIVHRYPDRLLLMPTHTCQVYCRFCFRREKVGNGEGTLSPAELDAAIGYIAAHPEVFEVILTGGDPLVLSDRRLGDIIQRISAIPHVSVIRLHSRVPVVEPERITPQLVKALKAKPATYMAIHVNHAQELTENVCAALARLSDAGIPLLSQTVLLKGINDNAEVLIELFRKLVANRVKPYYLHHLDKAPGTSHFRVPLAEGQKIVRQLRGKLSGLAQPTYVLDISGGYGKVPITPAWVQEVSDGDYEVTDPQGGVHHYRD